MVRATPRAIATHVAWSGQSLLVWAESADSRSGVAELPELLDTLERAAPAAAELLRKATEVDAELALPTVGRRPVPSPQMLALSPRPARSGATTLTPWRVPALSFAAGAVLHLVPQLVAVASECSEFLLFGGSWRSMANLCELVDDLVRRGRVLPTLTVDGAAEARWRPVLVGADAARARELAAMLAPSARAAMAGSSATGVVGAALDALTDAAARSRLPALLPPSRRPVPVAERWVAALTGSPSFAVAPEDGDDLRALTAGLATWEDEVAAPRQLRFRLIEPTADGTAPWIVEAALQSPEDPSLILPAAAIWAGETRGFARGEEELLAGLGRAARLYPELRDELRKAAPSAVETDASGAHRFVTRTAPLLLAAGFGVQLPAGLGRTRPSLKLTTRATSKVGSVRTGGFGQDDLVDFRFELALGDDVLSEDELADLARLKAPLVRLRGRWVELDQGHLRKVLAVLERRGSGTMTAGEAMRLAMYGTDADGHPAAVGATDLPVTQVDADGWLGDLLADATERTLEPIETPADFAGTLRPYQERGVSWLAFLGTLGFGGILADDMGLGKTVQLLALLLTEPGPTLLICPMSLVGNWQREAQKFAPNLRVHVHHGGGRLTGSELRDTLAASDVVLTTYAVAARDQADLAAVTWRRVVCDEAQFIKNSATKAARAVRALPASSRIALTGTPVENHLGDLWSLFDFTNPGLLGSATGFRTAFAVPIEREGSASAAEALKRATGPFILRRVKTDTSIIDDLPDKQEMVVWCNLTAEQATLYQATVDDMLDRIGGSDGMERRGLVLATMAKLKQICNHPAHLLGDRSALAGRSGKLARLEEILGEAVAEGDKALCFTQFAEFGRMLEPYLAARLTAPVSFLHGGVPKKARDALVEKFQRTDGPGVLLLSLKAGGSGLNLTAANHVIHYDRWWNPAVEDQATDRAFRIGQRKNVQVRKFTCVGTLEERIDAMIAEKRALAERIVGTGEGWLTELSVGELRSLVALSADAVSE
ncbi:SNF2-related protein [Cryptosporangium sp. NPDC048952]|uniref:SNF2-related protein n=1 Tax=Cryptosporangium sp. NPDC048952 TaxID=3363961 RepID=UPI003710AC4F